MPYIGCLIWFFSSSSDCRRDFWEAFKKTYEKIDVAATALFQQEASIFVLTTHRLKKRAGLQRRVGLEKLPQGLSHPDHMSIDSSYIPAS